MGKPGSKFGKKLGKCFGVLLARQMVALKGAYDHCLVGEGLISRRPLCRLPEIGNDLAGEESVRPEMLERRFEFVSRPVKQVRLDDLLSRIDAGDKVFLEHRNRGHILVGPPARAKGEA